MNPDTLQARAWEGLCALLLWVILTLSPALVAFPPWATLVSPVPSLLIVLDALGPSPLFVRWRIQLGPGGARRLTTILVGITIAVAWVTLTSPTPITDQAPVLTCAARDLWHGVDPYTTYEPQCLSQLHFVMTSVTPLEQGPFRNNSSFPSRAQIAAVMLRDQEQGSHAGFPPYGYPPDAALIILPVAYSGWLGGAIWVAALSAILLFAIWRRGLAGAAPAFAWQMCGLALLWTTLRWDPEILSYLLLALAFARIDKARLSSLAMAAAICTNPLGWPAAPVYLAILARHHERRRRWLWLGGGVAVGFLPWLVWDHQLIGQLWRFLTLREFPYGASLGTLARLPSGSHLVYTSAFVAGIAVCTFLAWHWPGWRWAMAAVVYGAFILSWRGLGYYYLPIFWLSPAIVLGAIRLARSDAVASGRALETHPGEHALDAEALSPQTG